ncbi:hypothetical protein GCM10029964_080860 [Kibdelosporangium lantanae]
MIEATGSPVEWAVAHRAEVRSAVTAEGWVLVRGLDLTTPEQVGAVAAELGSLMEEREGHAKRHTYAPGVYSSSVWTDDMPMCMHHELSYARTFPRLMMFGCLSLADSGGEVELADARAVLRALRSPMFDDFISNGWQLTRNYHPEAGTPGKMPSAPRTRTSWKPTAGRTGSTSSGAPGNCSEPARPTQRCSPTR